MILATAPIYNVMLLVITFCRRLRFARQSHTVPHNVLLSKHRLDEDIFMKVFGIFFLLLAVLLSCVAGVYAVTNTPVALAVAFTACFALVVGVKWVADRR